MTNHPATTPSPRHCTSADLDGHQVTRPVTARATVTPDPSVHVADDTRSTVTTASPTLAPAVLPALIPVPVAAALLGLSRASAYRYAASGELPTKRFGRRVYVITCRIRDLLDDPTPLRADGEVAA